MTRNGDVLCFSCLLLKVVLQQKVKRMRVQNPLNQKYTRNDFLSKEMIETKLKTLSKTKDEVSRSLKTSRKKLKVTKN